jgi:hypothetical protein
METIVNNILASLRSSAYSNQILMISTILLLWISFAYYFHGFMLAYIPYPTARDANHAYMYIPKVFALSHGYMRSSAFDLWFPLLWYSYIAFWFGLFTPLSWFRIAPDTIAVEMNYLSWIFTLIGMLIASWELINLIKSYRNHSKESASAHIIHDHLFNISWMYILLWLTSGMGAFLVFVDNKTDLGIMFLILLWLIPGIRLITNLIHEVRWTKNDFEHNNKDLAILSWLFFGIAVLSKPTALFDVMSYGLLYVGLLIWILAMIGYMFIVPSILSLLKANNVDQYIPNMIAKVFLQAWAVIGVWDTIRHFFTQQIKYLKYIIIRFLSFVAILFIIKAPIIVATSINRKNELSPTIFIKKILLWHSISQTHISSHDSFSTPKILLTSNNFLQLAQTTNTLVTQPTSGTVINSWSTVLPSAINTDTKSTSLDYCKPGKYTNEELNKNLKEAIWDAYKEDVGRYVWYGQKEFVNPWRNFLFADDLCLSLHADARILCHATTINTFDLTNYKNLLTQLPVWSEGYNLLNKIILSWSVVSDLQSDSFKSDSIKILNTYRSERAIKSSAWNISIPYAYIIPFNITFNRSLQNLSSYYTDIGVVWLPLFIITILALLYALIRRDSLLAVFAWVTLFARWMWMMIGWAILRYGIGLIIWTIFTTILFLDRLGDHRWSMNTVWMHQLVIALMIVRWLVQFSLNFVRISSQWWSGPFVQYKFSNWFTQQFDETLSATTINKFPYKAKDILNLQFPHYNKIIALSDQRTGAEVLMIAGTYLQYFLNNQYNLFGDWFLMELRKLSSDWDQCKTYLRLKDKNRKYMAIDPNIWTIVMGWWNTTLFDRFFAKMDPVKGTIVEDGTMTMLAKMANNGYVKMVYSNNLWAKYAYTISDTMLSTKIWTTDENTLALMRARMATSRFWQNSQQIIGLIQGFFVERIANGDAIEDIADIYGKLVDAKKLKTIATQITSWPLDASNISKNTTDLSQDERLILSQYIQLSQLLKSNKNQFDQSIANLISQSIWWSSQLIVFEIP